MQLKRFQAKRTVSCQVTPFTPTTGLPIVYGLGGVLVAEVVVAGVLKEAGGGVREGLEVLDLACDLVATRHDVKVVRRARRDDASGDRALGVPLLLIACVDGVASELVLQLAVAAQRAVDRVVHLAVHSEPDSPVRVRLPYCKRPPLLHALFVENGGPEPEVWDARNHHCVSVEVKNPWWWCGDGEEDMLLHAGRVALRGLIGRELQRLLPVRDRHSRMHLCRRRMRVMSCGAGGRREKRRVVMLQGVVLLLEVHVLLQQRVQPPLFLVLGLGELFLLPQLVQLRVHLHLLSLFVQLRFPRHLLLRDEMFKLRRVQPKSALAHGEAPTLVNGGHLQFLVLGLLLAVGFCLLFSHIDYLRH
mmetsp:Transcript_12609/g.24483  ORF Transcript_12609/g.24483 Transcript_12609/m.24483 type:complete len:360 (-) Transcript_12609:20-1099(-)